MKKVVFIGYMGSGKSVIAKQLSKKIGFSAVDLDLFIEKKCQMSISEIFSTHGELYFRKKEHHFFLELITDNKKRIISTGGGTPCYFNNHEWLITDNVVSIYLKASITTLQSRLVQERESRPLIANLDENELKEFIAKHLFERSFYYNKATHCVNVDNKTIEEIVNEVLNLLA